MTQLSPVALSHAQYATRVLDAVDHLDRPLGALRAIEALTECYKPDSEVDIPMLRRPDLASLLCLVANDLEHFQSKAREAVDAVLDAQPYSQPVTKGDQA